MSDIPVTVHRTGVSSIVTTKIGDEELSAKGKHTASALDLLNRKLRTRHIKVDAFLVDGYRLEVEQ